MSEASGQPAGFALNCASLQAFCRVVRRAGRTFGIVRFTLWMFASPGFCTIFTTSEAPSNLLVLLCVEIATPGLNGSAAQLAAWKVLATAAATPRVEVIVPPI